MNILLFLFFLYYGVYEARCRPACRLILSNSLSMPLAMLPMKSTLNISSQGASVDLREGAT